MKKQQLFTVTSAVETAQGFDNFHVASAFSLFEAREIVRKQPYDRDVSYYIDGKLYNPHAE